MRDYTITWKGDPEIVTPKVAQRLLNNKKEPSEAALVDDGIFGAKTHNAVVRFQQRSGLNGDGKVGPKTFAALGLKSIYTHNVRMYPQRQLHSCWAAAGAMLRGGREPSSGLAKEHPLGGLVDTDKNVQIFATTLGWLYMPGSVQIEWVIAALRRAPLWVGGDCVATRSQAGDVHAVVVAGIYLYTYQGKEIALLKVYDPWPVGTGRIYFLDFKDTKMPEGSIYVVRWFLSPPTWRR